MYNDQDIIILDLENILWAINLIKKRFSKIKTSDDFYENDDGLEKLDSICMRLSILGKL